MPSSALDKVKAAPGVDAAEGNVSADGNLLDKKGEPIVSNGPPTLLLSSSEKRFDPLTYREGGPPENDGEVVLDRGTAEKYGFKVGDNVTVSGRAPAKQYKVSGIATLGDSDNLAGSRMVLMTLPEAQRDDRPRRLRHDLGRGRGRHVAGGSSRRRSSTSSGGEYTVRTGKEQAEKQAQDLSDALGFIRTALLVFAGVALLVGGFLIFNTFAVTVAQRTREFALLRTLGASRRQILQLGDRRDRRGRPDRVDPRHPRRHCCSRPRCARCCRRSGIDLGTTGTVIEARDGDRRRCSSA